MQRQGDAIGALGPRAEDDDLGVGEPGHRVFLLLVMVGKDGCDAEQKIVIAADIGFEDHVDVDVGFRIGNVAQDGDIIVIADEAFDLPRGGDYILFDLMALGGVKRPARCQPSITRKSANCRSRRKRAHWLIARERRDLYPAWSARNVTWPARVAAMMAAEVAADAEKQSGKPVTVKARIMQRVLENHVATSLRRLQIFASTSKETTI